MVDAEKRHATGRHLVGSSSSWAAQCGVSTILTNQDSKIIKQQWMEAGKNLIILKFH